MGGGRIPLTIVPPPHTLSVLSPSVIEEPRGFGSQDPFREEHSLCLVGSVVDNHRTWETQQAPGESEEGKQL